MNNHPANRWAVWFAVGVLALATPVPASAQSDVENAIIYFGEENVGGYVQPLADLYGTDINSGFFPGASIPAEGFHFNIDFIGTGSVVGDEDKMYSAMLPPGFTETSAEQPTILGPRATLVSDGSGMEERVRGGGVGGSLFSYAVGQMTIGSVMGTEGFVRFVSSPELGSGK